MVIGRREFVRYGLGALAAPLLSGCGPDGPGDFGIPMDHFTARPGLPTLTPELGLQPLGLGADRDGLLYVPTTYTPDVAFPLFVALHGAQGSASDWQSYPNRAEVRGMVLLVPESRRWSWDVVVSGGFGPDVRFMDEALAYTFERCRIDPARIAFGGFSDGASYALSLGVANGDLFSHLVAYSPGFYGPAAPVLGQPGVWISHGTQDAVLPFSHTRDRIIPDLEKAGLQVTFQEFDGGHAVPSEISDAALDWFLQVP